MKDFLLSQESINNLMQMYAENNQDMWKTACDYLKLGNNVQKMLRLMPKYHKNVRIGRNVRSASSIIMVELVRVISTDYLNTGVEIVDSTNALQSMEFLNNDEIDLSSEIFLTPDDSSSVMIMPMIIFGRGITPS